MYPQYFCFVFHLFSMNSASIGYSDPRCAEICASKNKLATVERSIYANMLKSKDTSCLVTCYLMDKGMTGTGQSTVNTSLSNNNIILAKNKGQQNMTKFTDNRNSTMIPKPQHQAQFDTKQTLSAKPVTIPVPKQLVIKPLQNIPIPGIANTGAPPPPAAILPPKPGSNLPTQDIMHMPYDFDPSRNIGQMFSEGINQDLNNNTSILTSGYLFGENSNPSPKPLTNTHKALINEMIRTHHETAKKKETTTKALNIPKRNIDEGSGHKLGGKETSFVLNNKAELYRDLNKLDSLIKREETQPVLLYQEANKLKKTEIEENTAKLINDANKSLSRTHTGSPMGFQESSSSENLTPLESDTEISQEIEQRHRERHGNKKKRRRQHKEDRETGLTRKEKEFKEEVLKNMNIKEQLTNSDLLITEPTKTEYKNINPDCILVGVTPRGISHVLTPENTPSEIFATHTDQENLVATEENIAQQNAHSSSLFGTSIDFINGSENSHNRKINDGFTDNIIDITHTGDDTTEKGQNIHRLSDSLEMMDHRKLIELENQINVLKNIHKEAVEDIQYRENISQEEQQEIHSRDEEESLMSHQRISAQMINEDIRRREEEEIRRQIEETQRMAFDGEMSITEQEKEMSRQQIEEERNIQQATEEEQINTQEAMESMNYPPINRVEYPLNTAVEPATVIQTGQGELIQTPTETIYAQLETVETAPPDVIAVPPLMPTPPIQSNNIVYSARSGKLTSTYHRNHVYTTGLTDVII